MARAGRFNLPPSREAAIARAQAQKVSTAQLYARFNASLVRYSLLGAAYELETSSALASLQVLNLFFEALNDAVNSKQTLARLHERVAKRTQAAILAHYDAHVGKDRAEPPSIQAAKRSRYEKGALRRALADDTFIAASAYEITFNFNHLDAVAPQWARLNFGAGAAGAHGSGEGHNINQAPGARTTQYQAALTKRLGSVLEAFNGIGPRPAFTIPKGFWFEGNKAVSPGSGHGQHFVPYSNKLASYVARQNKVNKAGRGKLFQGNYVKSGRGLAGRPYRQAKVFTGGLMQQKKVTKGIKSYKFIDAGLFEMVQALGEEYQKLFDTWVKLAMRKVPVGPLRIDTHLNAVPKSRITVSTNG